MEERIVPAYPPEDRELAGINQATCEHRWGKTEWYGYHYICERCFLPGKKESDTCRPTR